MDVEASYTLAVSTEVQLALSESPESP